MRVVHGRLPPQPVRPYLCFPTLFIMNVLTSLLSVMAHLDDRLPTLPPDLFSTLYGRINNPDWNISDLPTWKLSHPSSTDPSFAFGLMDPLTRTHQVNAIYRSLAQGKGDTRKRAEAALRHLVKALENGHNDIMEHLPLGLAAPICEAARSCQLSPAGDWPASAYQLIGRNDLAAGVNNSPDSSFSHGYRSVRDYLVRTSLRDVILLY